MLMLVDKGLLREEAYKVVQTAAHTAWNQPNGNFRALIEQNPQVQDKLSPSEIAECFNPNYHLRHLEDVYQRLNI
jgi:adenylosuccinate lyase